MLCVEVEKGIIQLKLFNIVLTDILFHSFGEHLCQYIEQWINRSAGILVLIKEFTKVCLASIRWSISTMWFII